MNRSILYALSAAALFGLSTPFAKLLLGELSPQLLGGLLYLGSGIGLSAVRLARDRGWAPTGLGKGEWPWLLGAVLFGGVLGPVLLMLGLTHTGGAAASLLLNLEAVFTALLAWLVFRENADRRVVLGMAVIVLGGVALSWPTGKAEPGQGMGALCIAAACLCWAIDNNLTRKVSASDAVFIAGSKGLIAGAVNTVLALAWGAVWPSGSVLGFTMLVGLSGYGLSLALFVLALRGLGAARTGAYFSTAPFIGAVVALMLLGEPATPMFWVAGALMGLGVCLHLSERHAHDHVHEPVEHRHLHRHDDHHGHTHGPDWDGREPHTHLHQHPYMVHKHPHFPDIHHGHSH